MLILLSYSCITRVRTGDTRSAGGISGGGTTLLHYLVTFLHQNRPECVAFIHDTAALADAAKADCEPIFSELAQIEAVLRTAATVLRRAPADAAGERALLQLHARAAVTAALYHETAAQLHAAVAVAADAMAFFGVAASVVPDAATAADAVARFHAAAATAAAAAAGAGSGLAAAWAAVPVLPARAGCLSASAAASLGAPAVLSWPQFFAVFAEFVAQFAAAERFLAFRKEREDAARRRDAHAAALKAIAAAGGRPNNNNGAMATPGGARKVSKTHNSGSESGCNERNGQQTPGKRECLATPPRAAYVTT